MLQRAKDLIRRGWAAFRFRRHWPWVLVALGLPLALKPVDSGCAAFLAWVGGLVLVLRALRWIWDRLLFRVSRRLWMILALMSVLPVVALALMLTSLSWLGLGAQVSRSTQQTLAAWEEALKTANGEASDAAALQALRTYGGAWVEHSRELPEGLEATFVGMVWADSHDPAAEAGRKDTYLRAVRKEPGGYRILSLNLGVLGDRAQAMAGGQVVFQLTPRKEGGERGETVTIKAGGRRRDTEAPVLVGQRETLATWTKGQALQGSGLFAPFNLPPLAFPIVDWATGRPMVLTATPETNLYALFAGFRSGERQVLSEGAVKAIVVIALVLLSLLLAQAVAEDLLLAVGLGAGLVAGRLGLELPGAPLLEVEEAEPLGAVGALAALDGAGLLPAALGARGLLLGGGLLSHRGRSIPGIGAGIKGLRLLAEGRELGPGPAPTRRGAR